jgi:hypothetical protein
LQNDWIILRILKASVESYNEQDFLTQTQPCIPSLATSWLRNEMMLSTGSIKKLTMPVQHLSIFVPFYFVFLQLMQQMIVTGHLHADDASTLYGRALQLNNLLIFSKSRVEEMEIRFCIQMTLVIYKLF